MSKHEATVTWERTTEDFTLRTYGRDHTWTFGTGSTIAASAAREFRGNPSLVNPEEAFVAAIASCHMLSFLAAAARRGIVVDAYSDAAVGSLQLRPEGGMAVTKVVLSPRISFAGDVPSDEQLKELHDSAHGECFIANSVKTRIEVRLPDDG